MPRKKQHTQGSVLSVVSGIPWGEGGLGNIPPADEGGTTVINQFPLVSTWRDDITLQSCRYEN